MYLWAVVHAESRCVTLPTAIHTSHVCLPAGGVTDGPSEHCSLSPTPYRSPLDVMIWVFISRSPSQVVALALMSQLLWRNSSSHCATPGGLYNRVLHLANGVVGSKVKPPILQSLFCPHYSVESQYVVMYSTRCQQCGALGESHDLGSLFKR